MNKWKILKRYYRAREMIGFSGEFATSVDLKVLAIMWEYMRKEEVSKGN